MARIFLSHSSDNNAEAVALHDWLEQQGWKDEVFLDLDPKRGIAAGERWERRLHEATNRCEAVLFLVSKAWIASGWCRKEMGLAHHLNKRLFGVLIEDLTIEEVPKDLSGDWQLVRLTSGRDHLILRAILPITHEEKHVTFSAEGLQRLKRGLEQAGLDAKYFAWPPERDPDRPPYRGLSPLEADDAGIFFGRDAPVIEALDRLRGLREAAPPRLLVILGASGAGKSSFMRAGLLPRLARDDRNFLPLPVIRPERAVVSGEVGFISALDAACRISGMAQTRPALRAAVDGGAAGLRPLLHALVHRMTPSTAEEGEKPKVPTLILSIDQGEELFFAEGQHEAEPFLATLRDLLIGDTPAITALLTIRSDNYERLQLAKELEDVRQQTLSLPPMPKGSYSEVIKGPVRRLEGTPRNLKIDDALVHEVLTDIEAGGAKDALPLLAFTLERLYSEYGASGELNVSQYQQLGRIKGSIEAAVARAFKTADADGRIPRDREARLTLLRRGLIPWLAGIDPDTKAPRRRVARLSEIPTEARALMDLLVEQRLLSTDVANDTGESTIEPAHEALLRQWGLLQGWLSDDTGLLTELDGIKRAARDWAANGKAPSWLAHGGERLRASKRLLARSDLAANLEPTDKDYVTACQRHERADRRRERRTKVVLGGLVASVVGVAMLAYAGFLNPTYLEGLANGVKSRMQDARLQAGDVIRDCASDDCPQMVMLPLGEFLMGSSDIEPEHNDDEGPQHKVTITRPFLVSKYEVTFAEWDACVAAAACSYRPDDEKKGRGRNPVANVSWRDIQQYLEWLTRKTGRSYRLLTESEWEYAARGGSTTSYHWGDKFETGQANCDGCQTKWDWDPAPVGSFHPNAWGLHDMLGNVHEWVEDTWHENYVMAPSDGSAWINNVDPRFRVLRGGSWGGLPNTLRTASRFRDDLDTRVFNYGFRIARRWN